MTALRFDLRLRPRANDVTARPAGRAIDPRLVWPALVALTGIAAALRLPFLAHQSLWFDEVFTRTIVAEHGLGAVWHQIGQTESTPPLYYLVTKLAVALAGTPTAAVLRAPSAAALTLAVPVTYVAFRRLIGDAAALAAAAFVAVNPLLVSYATDARSYGLLVLTALLSVWACSAILDGGGRRAYAAWVAASIACVWTHYFGAFTVAGEALVLLVALPQRRRETVAWSMLILAGVAPLVPLLVNQNGRGESAFIAAIPLSTRLEQAVRQSAAGPNVPRAWLEAAGLVVAYLALVGGVAATLRRPRGWVVVALGVATVGVPLAAGLLGVEDRFYARNVIVGVPLLAAVAAPGLLRLRALPLVVYLAIAAVTSVWVATDWRYEAADWRAAVSAAATIDRGNPVIAYGTDSANVAGVYLRRPVASGPVLTRHALLIVQPFRGAGDRALVPAPVPVGAVPGLGRFRATGSLVVRGFRLIELTAPAPAALGPGTPPGAAVFAARAG